MFLFIPAIAFFIYSYFTTLSQSYPVSYLVISVPEIKASSLKEIEDSQILLIGDHFAEALEKYLRSTDGPIAKTAQKLKAPLKLSILSTQNLGLHRINFLLKSLKKLPGLIIFHGSASEYFEKKIDPIDFPTYKHNIKLFQNPSLATLLMSFPVIGRFIYHPLHYLFMNKITKNEEEINADLKMSSIEINNIIFHYELETLAQIIRKSNSDLIVITTPVNIQKAPHEACAQSITSGITDFQSEQANKMAQQNFKNAYYSLEKLIKSSPGNAQSYYLLANAALGLGLFDVARDAYIKANAFDCAPEGSSVLINQAIRQWVLKNSFKIIDFDDDLSHQIGHNDIFINDHYPQDYYYQQVLTSITEAIMRYFRL